MSRGSLGVLEVAGYGTVAEASEALDELLADGVEPDHVRFRSVDGARHWWVRGQVGA